MEEYLETIFAKELEKDPSCKTCKNKPKLQESGIFWFGVWMAVMSLYGNIMLFKQIFNLIFD
jgi:hypothetical protein